MRVACARRNEAQACSPLPLGSSSATRRARGPATSDFTVLADATIDLSGVLAVASILNCFGRTIMSTELQADVARPGRYLEPRPGVSEGRLRGSLPRRTFKGEFQEIGFR